MVEANNTGILGMIHFNLYLKIVKSNLAFISIDNQMKKGPIFGRIKNHIPDIGLHLKGLDTLWTWIFVS